MTETKTKPTISSEAKKRDKRIGQWLDRHAKEIEGMESRGHGIPSRLKWPTEDAKLRGTAFKHPRLPMGCVYIYGRPSANAELEYLTVGARTARPAL